MLSGWEIAAVVGLIMALLVGLVVVIAYLAADKPLASPRQRVSLPAIVLRQTASVGARRISLRSAETKPIGAPVIHPLANGSNIETREVKEDLDLYCKLTGRIVRECRCADCRELRARLGH